MSASILIINGPNLNLLGRREPEVYGSVSFEDYFPQLVAAFPGTDLSWFQSNHEGALIDKLHEAGFTCDGIVMNPGGYGHTSIALRDAIASIPAPVIEVHISDILQRETFRRQTMTGDVCRAMITGKGLDGYREAIALLLQK